MATPIMINGYQQPIEGDNDSVVTRALMFINHNIGRPLFVREVAEHLCITRQTLARHFRETLGCTVLSVIRHIRLHHARRLLRETRDSITAVALQSGYSTPSALADHFRREGHVTPRQYRDRFGRQTNEALPGTAPSSHDSEIIRKLVECSK